MGLRQDTDVVPETPKPDVESNRQCTSIEAARFLAPEKADEVHGR